MKRTKTVLDMRTHPAHWQVSSTWDIPESIKLPRGHDRRLISRQHEIALKGAPSQWVLFERHVYNPDNDKEWIDAFTQGGYTAFTAFRPDRIVKVRKRAVRRKKTETVDTNGAT